MTSLVLAFRIRIADLAAKLEMKRKSLGIQRTFCLSV